MSHLLQLFPRHLLKWVNCTLLRTTPLSKAIMACNSSGLWLYVHIFNKNLKAGTIFIFTTSQSIWYILDAQQMFQFSSEILFTDVYPTPNQSLALVLKTYLLSECMHNSTQCSRKNIKACIILNSICWAHTTCLALFYPKTFYKCNPKCHFMILTIPYVPTV